MPQTVTKKWIDRSTDTYFQFAFYCDVCGKEFLSKRYAFIHHFPERLSSEQRKALDILWRTDHDAALNRANAEAALYFEALPECGHIVHFSSSRAPEATSELTNREKEVFTLLMQGKKRAETANILFVSEETVKKHITSIYAKLGVSSRSELFLKFK